MSDLVEVFCQGCQQTLIIARVGWTLCPCGARHRLVAPVAPLLCPECRDGKCGNCIGEALSEADELVSCECTNHMIGDPCPTCDVDENAPNPACASWVHPGNGPRRDHENRSSDV